MWTKQEDRQILCFIWTWFFDGLLPSSNFLSVGFMCSSKLCLLYRVQKMFGNRMWICKPVKKKKPHVEDAIITTNENSRQIPHFNMMDYTILVYFKSKQVLFQNEQTVLETKLTARWSMGNPKMLSTRRMKVAPIVMTLFQGFSEVAQHFCSQRGQSTGCEMWQWHCLLFQVEAEVTKLKLCTS